MLKRALTWLMIGFLVFWIVTAPEQVSKALKSTMHELHRGADSVVTVIQDL